MVLAMVLPYNVIGLWLAVLIAVVVGFRLFLPHRRSIVLCPRSKRPAAVDVDGHLAIEACSRWSNLQDCNLGCLPQLCFSAEELESFLGKHESCRMCGSTLSRDDWYASRLAGVNRARSTRGLIPDDDFQVLCSSYDQLRTATRICQ